MVETDNQDQEVRNLLLDVAQHGHSMAHALKKLADDRGTLDDVLALLRRHLHGALLATDKLIERLRVPTSR